MVEATTQHKWRHMTEEELELHLKHWGSSGIQFFAICSICECVRRTSGFVKKERFYTRKGSWWATTYYKAPKCENHHP